MAFGLVDSGSSFESVLLTLPTQLQFVKDSSSESLRTACRRQVHTDNGETLCNMDIEKKPCQFYGMIVYRMERCPAYCSYTISGFGNERIKGVSVLKAGASDVVTWTESGTQARTWPKRVEESTSPQRLLGEEDGMSPSK